MKKLINLKTKSLAFLLVTIMLFAMLPMQTVFAEESALPEGYVTDGNKIMAYADKGNNVYDVMGNVNEDWKEVTYGNCGIAAALYKGTGIEITSTPKFVANGKGIRIVYKLTNKTQNTISNFKFLVGTDTEVCGNDASANTVDSNNILRMTDQDTSLFAFTTSKGGTIVPTECGYIPEILYIMQYHEDIPDDFEETDPATVKFVNDAHDSAFVLYFENATLAAGESMEYDFIAGMGTNDTINGIIDEIFADLVIQKINAIGTVEFSDECKARIDDARTAYDALTDARKALVSNYKTLTDDEELYRILSIATIIDGGNQTIDVSKDFTATFRSNAPFKRFVKVVVDDKELDKQYYDVKEGSTIVTLKPEFVKTLANGNHKLSIVSTNGSADCEFTISGQPEASPATGNNGNFALWIALLAISSLGIFAVISSRKIAE